MWATLGLHFILLTLSNYAKNLTLVAISKFYERLPKGTLIAVQEFLEENIYHRNAKLDNEEDIV